MIRLVICAGQRAEGLHLRKVIDAYATHHGIFNIETLVMNSREEFGKLLALLKPDFFDIAICRIDGRCAEMSLQEIADSATNMKALTPHTRFVFMSSDDNHALCAYRAGGKFLPLPLVQEEFESVIGKAILETVRARRKFFAIKSGKTVVNLNLDDVSFIEVGKKGPIVHLPEHTVVVTRTTLQALYERLHQASDSFMKVGGSFIVNLENMSSASETSAIFGDGQTIILPTRLRKPVAEALRTRCLRQ
ncbi:MAG: LytTR family transcriptional regulator DNA-binding domain-containing protein [Eggerthellaceae bacterium]|nr:LytTR family transcriptional regulator DNA-binding domain-containing protein [Eggerthellaceae bacterium]